jgi:hypothetical protein
MESTNLQMLVKESNNLINIKVRIPEKFKQERVLSGLKTDEVYLVSNWFNGIWVKADLNSSRIYPLCIPPNSVLEWEIV